MEKIKVLELIKKTLQECNFFDTTPYLQREAFLTAKEIIGSYPGIRILKQKSRHFIDAIHDKNAVHVERILKDCLTGAGPVNAYDLVLNLINEALNDLQIAA